MESAHFPYVHLRVRSDHSPKDGAARIDALVRAAAADGQPKIALTDEMNMFGVVSFVENCRAVGIAPIIGCDLRMQSKDEEPWTLTALCASDTGYRHLCRLISEAYRFDQGVIRTEKVVSVDDVFFLAGWDSIVGRHIQKKESEEAHRALRELSRQCGIWLRVVLSRIGWGSAVFEEVAAPMAVDLKIPMVTANDVRFVTPDEHRTHELRASILGGRPLEGGAPYASPEQWLKDSRTMAALFADREREIRNTVDLATWCHAAPFARKPPLPKFPLDEGMSEIELLRHLARIGLSRRLEEFGEYAERGVYERRLEEELEVIARTGYAGYFLIVADFVAQARKMGVAVGPGRGSGAGSLVAYALHITELDPIRFGLLFERFLNPERVSLPDFDIDFCMQRRDEVIRYVCEKYGADRVSQIVTLSTFGAKVAIRDCTRVLGLPYELGDRLARMVPLEPGIRIDDVLSGEGRKEEFRALYERDGEARTVIDHARRIEGLMRQPGRHAGGVMIAPGPITDYIPLYEMEGHVVTQVPKDDLEKIGLVKFDFLGLRTLTVIDDVVKRLEDAGTVIDWASIPLDDEATYRLIASGDTVGVFQLESEGIRRLAMMLGPDRFDDIIALVALFRPGPLDTGMVQSYIERKNGREKIEIPHPRLRSILEPTYGVIVYQEQVMQIAQILAGYSLGEADLLRRAMGKKKAEEMAAHRERFVERAVTNGVERDLAERIFSQMETFAGYGFNKSHAAAYAMITYRCAYLKAHHRAHYMASVMSSEMNDSERMADLVKDVRRAEIEILPPDVRTCGWEWQAIDEKTIRFGLGSVKGLGETAGRALIADRENKGGYADFADFLVRAKESKLNARAIEALIKAGALDAFGRRGELLQIAQKARSSGKTTVVPEKYDAQEGEKEAIGFYFSAHPFDRWRRQIRKHCSQDISTLLRNGKGRTVVAGGLVTALRKREDGSAIATIEDDGGALRVFLSADLAKGVDVGQPCVIRGQMSQDDAFLYGKALILTTAAGRGR
jgi:DNA polymerase-3 subunit alpha